MGPPRIFSTSRSTSMTRRSESACNKTRATASPTEPSLRFLVLPVPVNVERSRTTSRLSRPLRRSKRVVAVSCESTLIRSTVGRSSHRRHDLGGVARWKGAGPSPRAVVSLVTSRAFARALLSGGSSAALLSLEPEPVGGRGLQAVSLGPPQRARTDCRRRPSRVHQGCASTQIASTRGVSRHAETLCNSAC